MKQVIGCLALLLLVGCSTIAVTPDARIEDHRQATVTLVDETRLKGRGFSLESGQVRLGQGEHARQLSASEIHQIETIDRAGPAKRAGQIGLAVAGAATLYQIVMAPPGFRELFILVAPVAVAVPAAAAAAAGYVIGARRYYHFNPLESAKGQDKADGLAGAISAGRKGNSGRYHLGVTLGGGGAWLPAQSSGITQVGRARTGSVFDVSLELGRWRDGRGLWGAQLLLFNRFDGDQAHSVDRSLFAVGPQYTHFPRGEGMFYKGGVSLAFYDESIQAMGQPDAAPAHGQSYQGLGGAVAIGYAEPVFKRLWVSGELGAQGFYLAGTSPVASLALRAGVHWY